ncbi:MAG: 16S rRNA (adenine(1518)-N(6)/adenine(1519)-N(6))-dimethyltransferase RsmA [Planctomycetota bacterium]|jgi:16S rRNA (adenine1518-N6/adenine1519-N6)-dimethyltransferase
MQTKQQIQALLAAAGIGPNKRLGQHFLIDLNLMRLLVESADIKSDDVVLEVGCGTGSLTEALAEKAGYCLAVELDERIAAIAARSLSHADNISLVRADILQSKHTIDPAVTEALQAAQTNCTGRLLLVANLPYSVATPVMVNLITGPIIADAMYVTVQKQVADRMTAAPPGKDYGSLSILLSATGDVEMMRVLKPTVFWPAPQVDSAMVAFARRQDKVRRIMDMELFARVVNFFMGHRRKMLKACTKLADDRLAAVNDWQSLFERAAIQPTDRPEQLRPEQYINLSNVCRESL